MQVLVTGATGFVGRHLVACLLDRGHDVSVVYRDAQRAKSMPWIDRVRAFEGELSDFTSLGVEQLGTSDVLVHLAWPGLPNYRGLFHFEKNLPESYQFLKSAIQAGHRRILVTGTCFEYGMQQGCLSETDETKPSNPYGLAKDCLRRYLEMLQSEQDFTLQWCRLFYMFGEGQNPKSLLSQLENAIHRGETRFPMSGGEQIRDFSPVVEVAKKLSQLIETPTATGIFNVCSGTPISVRRLVEERVHFLKASIELDLGVFPYPDYEPFAFWGDAAKSHSIRDKT